MKNRDFIPGTIPGLVQWSNVFTFGVAAVPGPLGIGAPLVTALVTAQSDMASKVGLGTDPATRTAVSIDGMHTSIAIFKTLARKVAKLIHAQPDITNGQLAALGLTVPRGRAPVHAPTSHPGAEVVNRWASSVEVQFLNTAAANQRQKPRGCTGLNVYVAVGQLPADTSGWTFAGFFSRTRATIPFDPTLAAGTKVFICANWQTGRGETSPACSPIETTIDGTGMQMTSQGMKIAA
jgi:hypothetical protein